MNIVDALYQEVLVRPIYNLLMFLYTATGEHAGLVMIIVGALVASLFIPWMITGYFDLVRTKNLKKQIEQIQLEVNDPTEQQERILQLLKTKGISFKSGSVFLFGMAASLLALYPTMINHWSSLNPSLLYGFVPSPDHFSPMMFSIDLSQSSPALSMVPAILLFFELRQSYREQHFLTNFIDRWYPVILPLCVYFLIFWLPAGMSLMLASGIAVSLYLRLLLYIFASIRNKPNTGPGAATR